MIRSIQVLFVDDDPSVRRIFANELRANGLTVETAQDAESARERLRADGSPDVIVLDIRLPGLPGDEFLKELATLAPESQVVMLTGHADVELAVECMRSGAVDLLTKPCSVERLTLAIRRAAELGRLREANATLLSRRAGAIRDPEETLIGDAEPMRRLRRMIEKVAPTDETVLIMGESGAGKELVARELQLRGPRSAKPFITVNCAAVTETLLESELFGHEKGAFSGATERRLGFFELADGGTIFLDEIGDMPLSMQPKLLRALQSGEVRRVGSGKTLTVDVRVIAATNRSLADEVREGNFREDLMHRINAIVLEVPALRERAEDIETLAKRFLEEVAAGRPLEFAPETLEALRAHRWPGNVRELRNAIRRAAILAEEAVIEPGDLPPTVLSRGDSIGPALPAGTDPRDMTLAELERRHIISVLDLCAGNKTQAAKKLGISVKTLYNKFEAWGIGGR
jgi:DNA-binding NtrC family response regulator